MKSGGYNGKTSNSTSRDVYKRQTVAVISGVWKDTVGVIKAINQGKQSVTINVDMFGRETPVELNFTEVKKMQ